jgi:parvulin-like peptidyl-prolyl isomerase
MKENQYIREFPKNAVKKDKANKNRALWIGSIIVLVFAAASFIFIPTVSRAGGGAGGRAPFGYYNKKPIEYTAGSFFARMVEQYKNQMQQPGQQESADLLFRIFQAAFNTTVYNEAFSFAVEQSGYIVPEKAIARRMTPYFYDANGVYSPRLFANASQSQKIELSKEIARELVYQRYFDDVFGADSEKIEENALYGRKTAANEINFLSRLGAVERSFELASFNVSAFPESESESFARAHDELFTEYDFSVITANTEEEAKAVLNQISNNEILFEDAVKDISVKFYSGDDGKLTSPYQYVLKNIVSGEENFSKLTALETGALSGVIQTSNGYSVFRADAPSKTPDFADETVKRAVFNYLRSYERSVIEDYFINAANDFAAAAARNGFLSACGEFGISRIEVPAFPLNYGNSELFAIVPTTIAELSGAQTNEKFLQTAFALRDGEISSPVVLGDNVLVLKMLAETQKGEDLNAAEWIIPDRARQFDMNALETAVMADEKLKNDFVNVFFTNYMGN